MRQITFAIVLFILAAGIWESFIGLRPEAPGRTPMTVLMSQMVGRRFQVKLFSVTVTEVEQELERVDPQGVIFPKTRETMPQFLKNHFKDVSKLSKSEQEKVDAETQRLGEVLVTCAGQEERVIYLKANAAKIETARNWSAGIPLVCALLLLLESAFQFITRWKILRLCPDAKGLSLFAQITVLIAGFQKHKNRADENESRNRKQGQEIAELKKQLEDLSKPKVQVVLNPPPEPEKPTPQGPGPGGQPAIPVARITGRYNIHSFLPEFPQADETPETDENDLIWGQFPAAKSYRTADYGPIFEIKITNLDYLQRRYPEKEELNQVLHQLHLTIRYRICEEFREAEVEQFELTREAIFWLTPVEYRGTDVSKVQLVILEVLDPEVHTYFVDEVRQMIKIGVDRWANQASSGGVSSFVELGNLLQQSN